MALLVLVMACSAAAHAADLTGDLDRLLATVPAGGRAAVVVYDIDAGQIRYRARGEIPLALASVTKVVVSGAALLDLGPRYTFVTRVVALGPISGGAIPGLGIIGGGDPCLDDKFYGGDPDRVFQGWATHLKARGITRIAGDIIIDDRLFSGPIRPPTYPQDAENQQRWYSAPASAFAWNDNCIDVRVVPTRPGEPCLVQVRPKSARITIRNQTRTAADKRPSPLLVRRDADGNHLTVSGTYSRTAGWFPLAIHSDPALMAGDHCRAVFEAAGITVTGAVRLGSVDAAATELVSERHELLPALTVLNQRSQNFYGEQILRTLGAIRRGTGSTEAGAAAVDDVLRQHLGADISGYRLQDGSGLSYGNEGCADFIARLLISLALHPLGRDFESTLKVMDGGVGNRVKGRVKTGTLAIANNLAGYLRPPDGSRHVFVILLNRGDANGFGWASILRERIFQTICRSL